MTTNRESYDVRLSKGSGVLGSICFYSGVKGWLFISAVTSHGNGRKPRATAPEAIPRWAKKMGATLTERPGAPS